MTGQVGVNTTNPQQTLHIAGSLENIRVEGLNYLNNPNNLGMGNTTRVFVNSQGNLVLGSIDDIPPLLIDSGNYLEDQETPENMVVQVGHGTGYTPTASPIDWANYVFTLTATAMVEVSYSISWNIYNQIDDKRKRIDDNRARVVHTGMYFMKIFDPTCQTPYCGNSASVPTCDPSNTSSNCYVVKDADDSFINGGPWCIRPVNENTCTNYAGLVGLNGQYYTNSNSEHGEYQNLRTNGTDYVKLPPGSYLGMFACKLEVEDTGGSGSAKLWLGPGKDEVQIRIYYLD
jgi:hypothetical protein